MARIGDQVIKVPYNDTVVCPVCTKGIPVDAYVRLTDGSARHSGTSNGKRHVSATITAKVERITFSHSCDIEEDDD